MADSIIKQLEAAVDKEALGALKNLVGDGFSALLQRFIHDAEQKIRLMQLAYDKEDWVEMYELAHGLKGSSGTLCAQRLCASCQLLEQTVLKQRASSNSEVTDIDEIGDEIQRVQREFRQVRYALEEFNCLEAS